MGERSSYTPGMFCWTDLTTTDQEGAKKFYGDLLGWSYEDNPVGDDMVYSQAQLDGKNVAAISPQPQMQREAGVPPAWNNYVSVEDADAAAQKAEELGANVHAPPFDVMDVGRMAVVQDPQGAFFMFWQPKEHFGAAVVNDVGALCWNELASNDLDGSQKFYEEMFGWTFSEIPGAEPPYRLFKNGEENGGGLRQAQGPEPNYWVPYFGVEDVEASLAKIDELGGNRMVGPLDVQTPASGPGKAGVGQDPQGAVFCIYAGGYED